MLAKVTNWISKLSAFTKLAPVIGVLATVTTYNSTRCIILKDDVAELNREIAILEAKPDTCTHILYITEKRDSLILSTIVKDSVVYSSLEIPYNYPPSDSLLFSSAFVSLDDATATFKVTSTHGINFINTDDGKVVLPIYVMKNSEIIVIPQKGDTSK